ncbi:MAG: glycosyltransferase [Candidatus Omnitrophica bacterium]|nr:glycosyltransferase [Candidatus Omnitrophota bacterium]
MSNNCRILYVSYNGLLEEIVPSQVVPYLRELTKRGYRFTLLTFEKKEKLNAVGKNGVKKLKNELKQIGVDWHWLRYHKRAPLFATSFDVLVGTVYVLFLVITGKIDIIHARSIVPAAMSLVAKLFGAKFIFDTRGLLAEEYVGGGHWKEGELKYRIVKFFEKFCLKLADTIVVLTQQHYKYLLNLSWLKNKSRDLPIEVIPCCVDLSRFRYDFPRANMIKGKENMQDNFIFTYLGKIGKHYMFKEMIDFVKDALGILPNAKFMILTQSDKQMVLDIASNNDIDHSKLIIKKPTFDEIPSLVSTASAGIFFINPYKKFGSSPIKLGEFLSCGIPVIINSGIGDTEGLVKENRVGAVVGGFDKTSYTSAFCELLGLMKEGESLSKRCRKTVEDHLSLDLGVRKYSSVYERVQGCTP